MRKLLAWMFVMCLLFSGCSLAVEESAADGPVTGDRLVGVVVTTEYLDLFDLEGYLRDNSEALNGGEIDTTGYEGRIYAQEVRAENTTEDGVPCVTVYYNFDHVEGIPLLFYEAKTVLEDGTVHSTFQTGECGEGLWEVMFGGACTEGTIFVPKDGGEKKFFPNPVYQDGEGRLYLVSGTGISSQSDLGSMSQTTKEESTITMDGETQSDSREFKITVEWIDLPDTVTVLQLDETHAVLKNETYEPENLPGELIPVEGCAYILVEQRTGERTTRTLLQPGDRNVTVYRPLEGKTYCTGTVMEIRWPET